METICVGDPVRCETFREIEFFPTIKLFQFDFNFRGSIERALEINSVKSLKTLVDFFFEEINSQDYYPLIMNDLALILDSKQIEINNFFEVSNK